MVSNELLLLEKKYRSIDTLRDVIGLIKKLSERLDRPVKIMNFCGTHEWTITHYGLRNLVPRRVELVAGPGCPVCITPGCYIDIAVKLSLEGYTVLTYGDAYKLKGDTGATPSSLSDARAYGGSVRIVYGFIDAVKIARENPGDYVFLGVGFETTAPSVSTVLETGRAPDNLLVLPVYRLTPPIMRYMLESSESIPIDGIIAPGHVSSIIGASSWEFVARDYGKPIVVAGFEPLDVLLAVAEILRQLVKGEARLVNEYKRVVAWNGNLAAKKSMSRVFREEDAVWRGIGLVPRSGYVLRREYAKNDAIEVLGLHNDIRRCSKETPPGCKCSEIVLGRAKPTDCPLFLKTCTPEKPYGPCMVSSEGTCYIWAKHRSLEDLDLGKNRD